MIQHSLKNKLVNYTSKDLSVPTYPIHPTTAKLAFITKLTMLSWPAPDQDLFNPFIPPNCTAQSVFSFLPFAPMTCVLIRVALNLVGRW